MLTELPLHPRPAQPVAGLFPRSAPKPVAAGGRDGAAQAEAKAAVPFVFHAHTACFELDRLSLVLIGLPTAQESTPAAAQALDVTGCLLSRQGPMTRPTLRIWLRGAPAALFGPAASGAGADRSGHLDRRLQKDAGLDRLLQILMAMQDAEAELGPGCVNAIGLAIVSRIVTLHAAADAPATGRTKSPLPKWRLKRVTEFVDAHLAETITLADMAGAAGLTRMHFAAQFRVATGMRPHEYLLRRRIARAQDLLALPGASLVDVALSVGFQTQPHFTTVFKRFTGQTPHRWRSAQLLEACA